MTDSSRLLDDNDESNSLSPDCALRKGVSAIMRRCAINYFLALKYTHHKLVEILDCFVGLK